MLFLNYFKQRKEARLREFERKRSFSEKKVLDLKTQIQLIEKRASDLATKNNHKEWEKESKSDSTCPKCGSKKVNERIKRQQGEINGEMHGKSSSFLFFGSGYLDGEVKGSLDTNEVNKCNDCGNEWKKYEKNYKYSDEIIKDSLHHVFYLMKDHYDAEHVTFDPNDLDEKFNSLEEKKESNLKSANYWLDNVKEFWFGDIYIEVLIHLVKEKMDSYDNKRFFEYFNEKKLLLWGFKKYPEYIKK